MKSTQALKQMLFLNRRGFASGLYNYRGQNNPQVFLTVSKDGQSLGDLVFELYSNHTPVTAENFISICTGSNPSKLSYEGSKIDKGFPGIVI